MEMIKKLFLTIGIHKKYNKIWITKHLENTIWICILILSIYKNI